MNCEVCTLPMTKEVVRKKSPKPDGKNRTYNITRWRCSCGHAQTQFGQGTKEGGVRAAAMASLRAAGYADYQINYLNSQLDLSEPQTPEKIQKILKQLKDETY